MFNSGVMLKLLSASLILFGSGAAAALMFARANNLGRWLTHCLALAGTILILMLSIAGLHGGALQIVLPQILPLAGGLALGLDRVSAFFLLVISAGVIPSLLYAIGYTRHYKEKQPAMGFMLNLFIPAMLLVVLARNVLSFLLFWEVMSLASYFLVMTDSESRETRSAGWVYLV